MTSEAILRTLEESGRGFAAAVLGQRLDKDAPRPNRWIPTREFWLLGWMLIMALVLRRRPERMQRRVLLACSLLLTGAWLNLQYSTHHVMSLLSLRIPTQWFGGPCLLIVGVPLLAVWFGNIYCGYVCPFGAAQELFGDTRPARLTFDPGKRVWGYGRSLKYALLFLLVLVFAATRDFAVLSADPLTTLFSRLWDWPTLTLAGVVLGLSFPFRRFWCRSLCPAGAFLAMVGGLRLGRLWMPRVDPVRCDLGVRTKSELDCLSCDRCRHEAV
jgi:hypothetical protein